MPGTEQSYIGKGSIYLGPFDGSAKARPIGNCAKLELAISEDKKELPDYQNAGGGVANSISRISGIEASITLHDISPENLALAVFGSASAVAAGTVTDESHTAYLGGLVRLVNLPDTSTIVVTDSTGTTTYVLDTDYSVNEAGIVPLDTGAIVEGSTILVDYTKKAGNVVQAVVNSGQEFTMTFVGLNEAQSGKPVVVDLFRVKFSPTQGLGFIGDDFAAMDLTGSVLKDTGKTGAGISQYFKVEQAA
ncbi:MAG TPA: hypothetical protein ENJ17_01355 [Gammaproteobacteria bacterium]|nr:hypothetical protein [Gammaproteobacteria bacterium]